MKFEKFISFSLFNAFLLMITATMMASCQKKSFKTKGYFTTFNQKSNDKGRLPASFAPKKVSSAVKFQENVDVKQIYLYCVQNSIKTQQCFEQHYNNTLASHIQENGTIDAVDLVALKDKYNYSLVKMEVEVISSIILKELNPKIHKLVNKRSEFCKANAKKDHKKCLNQYVNRDSLAILNIYQHEKGRLNGQEYLYLKSNIKESLKKNLEQKHLEIQNI